jgi:16S rRNA (cytidine1402-2'-O)-methyltransferase
VFEGFLPLKKSRKKRLEFLSNEKRSIVIFESPHRIIKTVNDLILFFGKERRISISRELTKIHEENFRGNLLEALSFLENKNPKGEFVICIEGKK